MDTRTHAPESQDFLLPSLISLSLSTLPFPSFRSSRSLPHPAPHTPLSSSESPRRSAGPLARLGSAISAPEFGTRAWVPRCRGGLRPRIGGFCRGHARIDQAPGRNSGAVCLVPGGRRHCKLGARACRPAANLPLLSFHLVPGVAFRAATRFLARFPVGLRTKRGAAAASPSPDFFLPHWCGGGCNPR